jgi:hypothetical protein
LAIGVIVVLFLSLGRPQPTAGRAAAPSLATASTKDPNVLFEDNFADGRASPAWTFDPPKGYWSVSNGRLVASGPTIYGRGKYQRAETRLPSGVKSFQVDIEMHAGRTAGITVRSDTSRNKADKLASGLWLGWYVSSDVHSLWWGTWDLDFESPQRSMTIDRGAVHTFQVTLEENSTFTLRLDGKVFADRVSANAFSNWRNGIPAVQLHTEADAVGVIMNTRFSKARALAR